MGFCRVSFNTVGDRISYVLNQWAHIAFQMIMVAFKTAVMMALLQPIASRSCPGHLSWKKLRFRIGFEATNMVVQPPCNRLSPTETIMVQHRAARRPTFWMPFFSAIPWSTLTSRISGKMCPVRFTDLGLSVEGMGFWLLSEVGIGLYYVHYIYTHICMYACTYIYIYMHNCV